MPLKAILNSLISGIVSSIFALGFNFFGPILIFFSYFSPLPIFIITIYYGLFGTILSTLVSVGVIIFLTSTSIGIIFFITNIVPSIIILIDKKNAKLSYQNFISNLTLLNGLFYIAIMLIYSDKINNLINNFNNYMQESLGKNLLIEKAILDLAPAILISSWGLILVLNFILARKIITKHFNNFKDKILDIELQPWIIILFLLFLVPAALLNEENGKWFCSLALIYATPITIQGIAVIHSILKKNKRGAFLIYSFYALVFFIPFSVPLITAVGVLDHIYSFRGFKKKINSDID